MIQFQRKLLQDKYHSIEIFECPIEVIEYAAELGGESVTVENYRHYGKESIHTSLQIDCNSATIAPHLKRYEIDFQISKSDFFTLKSVWNTNGCYAIFCLLDREIPFRVSELVGIARYTALDNFEWNLELAIPGPASDGWGQIVSPDKNIIDKIENKIQLMS